MKLSDDKDIIAKMMNKRHKTLGIPEQTLNSIIQDLRDRAKYADEAYERLLKQESNDHLYHAGRKTELTLIILTLEHLREKANEVFNHGVKI